MILYRISVVTEHGEHKGYHHAGSYKEALGKILKLEKMWGVGSIDYERIQVLPGKKGLIAALNRFAGHPDNG